MFRDAILFHITYYYKKYLCFENNFLHYFFYTVQVIDYENNIIFTKHLFQRNNILRLTIARYNIISYNNIFLLYK